MASSVDRACEGLPDQGELGAAAVVDAHSLLLIVNARCISGDGPSAGASHARQVQLRSHIVIGSRCLDLKSMKQFNFHEYLATS